MLESAIKPTTASDIRAALARRRPRLHIYQLAVLVRLNPVTLSAVLNERKPLDAQLADRIMQAIATARP